MNNRLYIYNMEQANYFIKEGCKPIKIDKHHRTNKIFWVFDKEDAAVPFAKWANRSY